MFMAIIKKLSQIKPLKFSPKTISIQAKFAFNTINLPVLV
jgi:hypothetical protein